MPEGGDLTPAEACKVIEQIEYKKGWRIELLPHSWSDDWELRVSWNADDVHTKKPTKIVSAEIFDRRAIDHMDEGALLRRARGAIRNAEMHESDEWFLFRGQRLFDPHAGDQIR